MATGNPQAMFQARLDRYIYYQYITERNAKPDVQINPEFEQLISYYQRYFPAGTDSVKLIFVKKETGDFTIKTDTLYTIKHVVN